MAAVVKLDRREFFRLTAATGTGLILGAYLPGCGDDTGKGPDQPDPGEALEPSAYLGIDTDGQVTVYAHRTEMGQGIRTALAMLAAEELDADWSQVRSVGVIADPKYGPMSTGGSMSIKTNYHALRNAGAVARTMLVTAAAQTWGVSESACACEKGEVINSSTDERLSYGELVPAAKKLPVPTQFTKKDLADFTLIGTAQHRLDSPDKIDGSAVFGMDVRVPNMLFAVVARPPRLGGGVTSFDSTTAEAVPGVQQVVQVSTGVAVVADSTWAAIKGREALTITWEDGPNAALDNASLAAILDAKALEVPAEAKRTGDPDGALAAANTRLDAVYEVPFLAHAPMEPMNCTAHVTAEGCEIWVPTQDPEASLHAAATLLGIAYSAVTFHVTLAGGGFGSRFRTDFVLEAVEVSREVGAPVQVVWTREDDLAQGYHRPFSRHLLSGGLDATSGLTALSHVVVAPSISSQLYGSGSAMDPSAVAGIHDYGYEVPNMFVGYVKADTPVPIIWWRSVYRSQNPFANECFLDELAVAGGLDPLELRRSLLPAGSRLMDVLDLAASKADWGGGLPAGHGQGIACCGAYGSHIAQVAEVSVDAGNVVVRKVVCAVDCGPVINPDIVAAQMESGIVFGLSAALRGESTFLAGKVQQTNYDEYRMLEASEMPEVEVHLLESAWAPGGIGELAVPVIAPAVANAVFAATGIRIRKLPIGTI